MSKCCPICKKILPAEAFYPSTAKGLSAYCRVCTKIIRIKWYYENKERANNKSKEYHKKLENKKIAKVKRRERYLNNQEDELRKAREYQSKPENKKKMLERTNKYISNKRKIDPIFNFSLRIRRALNHAFNRIKTNKEGTTHQLLEYSSQELFDKLSVYLNKECEICKVIKLTIKESNYNIDHIIPQGSATTKEQILELNKLNNLRLICRSCNNKKAIEDKKFINNYKGVV